MTMKNLYKVFFVLFASFSSLPVSAVVNVQDWWWNPAMSGMGINIGQQDATLTVSWYLYSDDGNPTFLLLSGNLQGNRMEGSLTRSTGPAPSASFDPSQVKRTTVGSASIVFDTLNSGTFSYNYEGKTGSFAIQRFTFKEQPIAGSWLYAGTIQRQGCRNSSYNGSDADSGTARLSKVSGNNYTMTINSDYGGSCQYDFALNQGGSIMAGSGTLSCSGAWKGALSITRARAVDDFLLIEYSTQITSGESCKETGRIGATRY